MDRVSILVAKNIDKWADTWYIIYKKLFLSLLSQFLHATFLEIENMQMVCIMLFDNQYNVQRRYGFVYKYLNFRKSGHFRLQKSNDNAKSQKS